jgi:hypothetical protein
MQAVQQIGSLLRNGSALQTSPNTRCIAMDIAIRPSKSRFDLDRSYSVAIRWSVRSRADTVFSEYRCRTAGTNMRPIVLIDPLDLDYIVATVLNAAARFWFVATVVGQWVFAFALAAFHGQLNADNSNFVEMLWKITTH